MPIFILHRPYNAYIISESQNVAYRGLGPRLKRKNMTTKVARIYCTCSDAASPRSPIADDSQPEIT